MAERADSQTISGKRVFIIGGRNSAGQAALFFANCAMAVTILIRGEDLRNSMSQYLIDQIGVAANVSVENQTQVISVECTNSLQTINTRRDGEAAKQRTADSLFVMIGADAVTEWLPAQLQRRKGYICTGIEVTDFAHWRGDRAPYLLETSLPGLFCVGDVRHNSIKRVSSSVGEGSMAIAFIHQYLSSQNTA